MKNHPLHMSKYKVVVFREKLAKTSLLYTGRGDQPNQKETKKTQCNIHQTVHNGLRTRL